MQNVEIKAELREPEIARAICRKIGALHVATIEQTDTYFRISTGRLKKRESSEDPTEWIFYNRDDLAAARTSHYRIYSEDEAQEHFGRTALPVWIIVKKRRELWLAGSVRIHIDDVENLGRFIEFEAVVTRSKHSGKCHQAVAMLRREFAPALGEPIACSYSDLLAAETAPAD